MSSEDSDQPAHSRSLIRIFNGNILDSHIKDAEFLHADNEDIDQFAQMDRLIKLSLHVGGGGGGWGAHFRRYVLSCCDSV